MRSRNGILLFLLLALWYTPARSQTWPVSDIPLHLRVNARAVVREQNRLLKIISPSRMELTMRNVVTVINEKGEDAGLLIVPYDKFIKPGNISVRLFDAAGNLIRKVKSEEIRDFSTYDGFSLYSDNRVKYFRPVTEQFPYTVEIIYSLSYNGYPALPGWHPVRDCHISLEKAEFRVEAWPGACIRHQSRHVKEPYAEKGVKGADVYVWQISQFMAIPEEPLSAGALNVFPEVTLGCNDFEYDGSKGNASSWENLAAWASGLLIGREELPEATRRKVDELTGVVSNPVDKARILYQFLQERMRYVSIQLGIGGYQPFTAAQTDHWNYGDCKALTNYYIALLRAAGIEGLYTLTISEENFVDFRRDFPGNLYFNHVVAGVPIESDTIWVECTSRHVPFGHMGTSVAGHPALVVNGKTPVITTIRSVTGPGILLKNDNITLSADGSARLKARAVFRGGMLGDGIAQYLLSPAGQQKEINASLQLNDYTIQNLAYQYHRDDSASVVREMEIDIRKFASLQGDRLVFSPFVHAFLYFAPPPDSTRKLPVCMGEDVNLRNTTRILMPDGFWPESVPNDQTARSVAGLFSIEYKKQGSELIINHSLQIYKGMYDPIHFSEIRDFLLKVEKSGKRKVVIRKSGG